MKEKIIILLISYLFCPPLFAQDELVNDAAGAEAEFHVAINPLDSNNIVIATIHSFEGIANLTIYYTNDFGETWEISDFHGVNGGDNDTGFAFDPVVTFDDQGDVYLVNLYSIDQDMVTTALSKSVNGGETWTLASEVSINSDKPWLAVDCNPTNSSYGNIYIPMALGSGPALFTLDNDFNTISEFLITNGGDQLPSVAVRNNGDVFVGTVGISDPNEIFISQFTDGGTELVHTTSLVNFPDFTYNSPDVSERFQPTVYIAIDNSGGLYDGRLYVAYTASETGNSSYFDVFLMTSDDAGVSWSAPTPVHSDLTPDVQQFYSSLFVNDEGVLLIDWYDRRNYISPDENTDFFLGISHDGGDTFDEFQLNSASMDFQYTIQSSNGFGIGEYHQLVATNNTAICFWADGRTNDEDINIYMAKVNINNPTVGIVELGIVKEEISISSLYPNPINSQINFDMKLEKDYSLQYIIMDVNGKQLLTSEWIDYNRGEYQINHTFDLPAGNYLFQVKSDKGFFKTTKFTKP